MSGTMDFPYYVTLNVFSIFFFIYFVYRHSKDVAILRCQEKQMLKMADLIKTALNEVGCEELPSGCDDISVDPSFIENNMTNDQQPVGENILF